jgi:hypothetical protein
MGVYFVDDEGLLARRPISPAQELRPLEVVSAGYAAVR